MQEAPSQTSRVHHALEQFLSYSTFLLIGSSTIEAAEPPTNDVSYLQTDLTGQGNLIAWSSRESNVDELGFENLDLNLAAAAPLDLQFSGPAPDYDIYSTDDLGGNRIDLDNLNLFSDQTDLVLTPFNEDYTSEAKCNSEGEGVDMLSKRQACAVNRAIKEGSNPGLCPKFKNNIGITTCCCLNAVEYDPLTYPTYQPCYLCTYTLNIIAKNVFTNV